MVSHARTLLLTLLLLGSLLPGCRRSEPDREPTPFAPDPASADPAPDVEPTLTDAPAVAPFDEPAAESPDEPATPNRAADAGPKAYAARLRSRLLAGEADAVRESLPPGAMVTVGVFRRALTRAEPEERAAALSALETLAELIDRQPTFLANTEAVRQGDTPGVNLPAWVAPALRAIALGPATSANPADLTDATLIDGTVAVLLEDPAVQRALERWTVAEDVPLPPPSEPSPAAPKSTDPESTDPAPGGTATENGTPTDVGETGIVEDVLGTVKLTADGGKEEMIIPMVASEGAWVPSMVEATAPVWAAKAESAGGTGAAAVLATAGPHLKTALAATSQEEFDAALRSATDAALAAAADPPAPVPDDQKVTVELTRPLTLRQAADLILVFQAATDDPSRAVSRATPRASGPGWRVTVGPVVDVEAWLARVPVLAGATVEGRKVTIALDPPDAPPDAPPDGSPSQGQGEEGNGAGVESGEPGEAD